jgi:hypothetical protein
MLAWRELNLPALECPVAYGGPLILCEINLEFAATKCTVAFDISLDVRGRDCLQC